VSLDKQTDAATEAEMDSKGSSGKETKLVLGCFRFGREKSLRKTTALNQKRESGGGG